MLVASIFIPYSRFMAEPIDEAAAMAALEAKLAGGESPAEPVVETPVVAVEPVVEPVVEETPVVEPVVVEEPEGAPERIRLGGLSDADRHKVAAAVSLAKAENITVEEAMARLAPAKAEPVTTVDPTVAIQAELAENEKILTKAAEDGSYFTPELKAAFDKKTELQLKLQDLSTQKDLNDRELAKAASQTWEQTWDASIAKAEETYVDAKNPDSALCKAVGAEIEKISNDPKHRLYGLADLPELLFAKHAAAMRIAPVAKAAPAAKPGVQRLLPKTGAAGSTPPPVSNPAVQQAALQERYKNAIASGNDDELARLADEEVSGAPPPRHSSVLAFG